MNIDRNRMIEPPTLYTEERQEYDIMDLELLGKIAIELSVHAHPLVKRSFEKLVEVVGTKRFPEEYCALQKFLMRVHAQVTMAGEFAGYHMYSAPLPTSPSMQPSSLWSSATAFPSLSSGGGMSTSLSSSHLPVANTSLESGLVASAGSPRVAPMIPQVYRSLAHSPSTLRPRHHSEANS